MIDYKLQITVRENDDEKENNLAGGQMTKDN